MIFTSHINIAIETNNNTESFIDKYASFWAYFAQLC